MEKNTNKKSASALIGAAFLMATSAIGPGFLTQTGQFTGNLKGSFGFVILVSVILAAIVQLNVWRVLCVSGMRGQDVANKVLPGLGYVIAFLVVAGGLVFNIGNVGGGALGFNTLLGITTTYGCFLAGAIAICVFLYKNALDAMDTLTKILGGIMIVVIFVVILIVKPPVGMAVKETFVPTAPMDSIFPAILTLLGGTVGGYITFAGAHRLIDAGITPILCIGETEAQYDAGDSEKVIRDQLTGSLADMCPKCVGNMVIAYEPIWAIGTGKSASVEIAENCCRIVRDQIRVMYGDEAAENVRVQYGGSVKPNNIVEYMAQPDIDGALIGGASLKADSFIEIIEKTK